MPLESLQSKNPNIRGLSMETPKERPEPEFDFENIYTSEEWDNIRKVIKEEFDRRKEPFIENLAALKIVSKKQFDKLGFSPEDWEWMKEYSKEGVPLLYVALFKTLAPDFNFEDFPEAEKKLSENDWDNININNPQEYDNTIHNLFSLKILKPKKFAQLDKKAIFNKLISGPGFYFSTFDIGHLKFLFPKQWDEYDDKSMDYEWEKEKFQERELKDLTQLSWLALAAARKIDMTDEGLVLIYDDEENQGQEIPPQPKSKQY